MLKYFWRFHSDWLLALALLGCTAGFGQDDSTETSRAPLSVAERDAAIALRLAVRTYTAPLRWDGSDWLSAGGGAVLTGLAIAADHGTYTTMIRNRSAGNSRLANAAIRYGDGLDVAVGIGGLYFVGLLVPEPWLRETMVLAGTATLVSASFSTVAKFVVGRARPYTGKGNHSFRPFTFSDDYLSFPSGHTVVAFSVSSVLADRIANPWATVGFYGLATATALGRLYTLNHWLSDVVPAALCSIAIGRSIVRWYEGESESSSLHIVPGPEQLAIMYEW